MRVAGVCTHLSMGKVHGQGEARQQRVVVQGGVAEAGTQARPEAPHVLLPTPPQGRRCRRSEAADAADEKRVAIRVQAARPHALVPRTGRRSRTYGAWKASYIVLC